MTGIDASKADFDSVSNDGATIVEAIAKWCDCMTGNAPLRAGLRLLAESLGAQAIAVSRVRKDEGGAANTAIVDLLPHNDPGLRLTRSFAKIVLGRYFGKSKTGTLWFSSMLDGMFDPALKVFQQRRRLSEVVILPLGVADRHVDFIELHFASRLDADRLGLLNMAVSTLVQTWSRRASGLLSDAALTSARFASPIGIGNVPLLDFSNPVKLSRCEYRVCLLLSHGLHNDAIQREMSIAPSTLRTHLRNIYAKTECTSLAELTYKLLSNPAGQRSVTAMFNQIA